MVDYDVKNWEEKPANDKNFTNIKSHFNIEWRRYQNNQRITKMALRHSANAAAALVEEMVDAISAFTSKAVQDSQAAEEWNTKLLKEIAAMQVSINKVQYGGHGCRDEESQSPRRSRTCHKGHNVPLHS